MRRLLSLWRARGGSAAVEFAIVAPVLISFLFGGFEFGRVVWTQSMLDYAVEGAARCAAIDTATCTSNATTETYAAGLTGPLALASSTFTASTAGCGSQVSASYAVTFVAPRLLPYNLTLTAQSCYP